MDEDTGTGLPASIEAAWGLRERPHKGPKPTLSLERIVQAAMHIAVTEGLGAVSMSRVATELGGATMSLYRYVAAKDALLALMAARRPAHRDLVKDGARDCPGGPGRCVPPRTGTRGRCASRSAGFRSGPMRSPGLNRR